MSIHKQTAEKKVEQDKLNFLQAVWEDLQGPRQVKPKLYKINEIFYTIQGEGQHVGTPAVFIRFSACNLSCEWCDTEYDSGVMLEAEVILDAVMESHKGFTKKRPLIVCTGGEPSLQVDYNFTGVMSRAGYKLTMETNGIKWDDSMREFLTITISPKTLAGWWFNYYDKAPRSFMKHKVCLKVVYDTNNPTLLQIMEHVAKMPCAHLFLQPLEDQETEMSNVKAAIEYVQENPLWRLSLQTHKILGMR